MDGTTGRRLIWKRNMIVPRTQSREKMGPLYSVCAYRESGEM